MEAMDPDPAGLMQMQLRQNNDELLDYLKGLDTWETEMKEKDQSLVKNKSILKENLPPVRSVDSGSTKARKKKMKKEPTALGPGTAKSSRIRSYDYKSWDQFNVEKACEQVDYEVQSLSGSEGEGGEDEGGEVVQEEGWGGGQRGSGEGSSEDEEMERQRMLAIAEKEQGNVFYKEGKYESAVECYSRGILLDPLSAVLPANRAMALMKLERYAAVEKDCNTALALEEDYVKAYLRRGVARRHLGKFSEAIQDFEQVLKLEPANKQGSAELRTTRQLKEDVEKEALLAQGHVFPLKRPAHLRSKRPLKRIMINDIAGQMDTTNTNTDTNITDPSPDGQDITLNNNVDSHGASSSSSERTFKADCTNNKSNESGTHNSNHGSIMKMSTDSVGDGATLVSSPVVGDDDCQEEEALPPLPETTFEFQSHWKQLRNNRPQLVAYFGRLSPSSYPMLLQHSLETDIFSDIISLLKEDGARYKLDCIEELTWLTRVPRFSVAVMFLSKKDMNNLRSIFVGLMQACNSNSDTSAVKKLATEFSVKL